MEREKVSYEELEKAYLDQVEHTNLVRESYVEMLKKLDVTHESLKSRISALEAALSLSPENVKRVADHVLRAYLSPEIKRGAMSAATASIKAIRRIAGMEVKDGA